MTRSLFISYKIHRSQPFRSRIYRYVQRYVSLSAWRLRFTCGDYDRSIESWYQFASNIPSKDDRKVCHCGLMIRDVTWWKLPDFSCNVRMTQSLRRGFSKWLSEPRFLPCASCGILESSRLWEREWERNSKSALPRERVAGLATDTSWARATRNVHDSSCRCLCTITCTAYPRHRIVVSMIPPANSWICNWSWPATLLRTEQNNRASNILILKPPKQWKWLVISYKNYTNL